MTALRTRLANMMADLNIWLDRLSGWQFAAVVASINVLADVVAGCLLALTVKHANLSVFITSSVTETVVITGLFAWRRVEMRSRPKGDGEPPS
jgi:hypothetical protein